MLMERGRDQGTVSQDTSSSCHHLCREHTSAPQHASTNNQLVCYRVVIN